MSHHSSASVGAARAAVPVRPNTTFQPSFWRRFFDAWAQAHARRIDPAGNVM